MVHYEFKCKSCIIINDLFSAEDGGTERDSAL